MKNKLAILLLLPGLCLPVRAQVFILNDNMLAERLANVKTAVVDSLSGEPVPFASVYVIPSKDTTITNFTLSDAKGEAVLDEVPFGSYTFHVEMMGYRPFVRERYFRESEVDMGTIRLQQDEHFLEAATITDVGNPMIIKKDTVEFNASSFYVGANAMLKDLIKRMPGMEITDDGKVKFNGQVIDKLTVGGRTFFFDDQSAALNNLPAAIVDKIRVIDRESEATRATGIDDGTREKVLDVALKKEYEQGWFGNISLKGGLETKGDDDPLRDDRGFLYSANALVSAYTEKDQVTLIANQQNVDDSNITFVVVSSDGSMTSSLEQGLSTATQLGVNANTSRLKNVETTVSTSYKSTDTDSGTRSSRTTHQEGGDLLSNSDDSGTRLSREFTTDMEFQKETGRFWFHIRPSFSYSDHAGDEANSSETFWLGNRINESSSSNHSTGHYRYTGLDTDVNFRDIGGKKGRMVRIALYGSYSMSDGDDLQVSMLKTAGGTTDIRSLNYIDDWSERWAYGALRYVEPFGEKLTLTAETTMDYTLNNDVKDAFDDAGLNDYYSSRSRNKRREQMYGLTAQYKVDDKTTVSLGTRASGALNETFSKSYNIASTTGEDEWYWFVTPTFRLNYSDDKNRISTTLTGSSQQPSTSRMLPVLNVSNLSRLSLGNIYLRPYGYSDFYTNWTRNNRERFSTLTAYISSSIYTNQITDARWYDSDGILYSIPVNAKKPSVSMTMLLNYSTPLDEKKSWSLSLSSQVSYSSSQSYQTKGTLPGLDKDRFDYSGFMAAFWGNDTGDRFYGGQSGFEAGSTRSLSPSGGAGIRYNKDRFSFSTNANTSWRIARYSLNPDLDMTTSVNTLSGNGSYTTRNEWEFQSDLAFVFYTGYSAGFDKPEWRWNAEISKNIGSFNISLKAHDILDQTHNLSHNVTANYEEDTYRLVLGRYVLLGVKWNFGKMNAVHSQRAQSAALNMAF
ncbi:MAG: carboxypeptidase regulatory-like domain-containing protein [Bacteroidales bacterium]|nr:carboxypeptidase regulatory-like domain-containing protein [Bacteroidales bacterium]